MNARTCIVLLFFTLLFFCVPGLVQAAEPVSIYFFRGEGCPHCAKEELFLQGLKSEYAGNIDIHDYEIYHSHDNRDLMKQFAESYQYKLAGVPLTFIGNQVVSGYLSDETSGRDIRRIVDECLAVRCPDRGQDIINEIDKKNETSSQVENAPLTINVPFFGALNVSKYSLAGLTIVIGSIDGFNPCAMWVLIFLITMLMGMKNRRRMWILGLTFIASSALVYFIFLAAWLNFFKFIGVVRPVQIIIGLAAGAIGIYYLRRFWTTRPGVCEVTDIEQRQQIAGRIKRIVREQALWLALGGIIALAAIVNLIELACSAGLPAIFTQVLALHQIPAWQHYLYLILYIFIFMLDDVIVFTIAMLTLKTVSHSGRYSRYGMLVGGIIIFILGILLVFKPAWVMLG